MILSRKQRQKLQNKEEILSTALGLFAEKGFHNVTMREIAKQAEFSIGTIYNFFKNKEALFTELLSEPAHRIQNEFMKILDAEQSETQKIADFILCHNRISIENKEGYKLYFSGLGSGDLLNMKIVQEIEQMRADVRKKLTSVFKAGIQKSVFINLNPELMTMTLKASLESLLNKLFEGCNEDELRRFAEQLIDFYLNGVLNQENRRFYAAE